MRSYFSLVGICLVFFMGGCSHKERNNLFVTGVVKDNFGNPVGEMNIQVSKLAFQAKTDGQGKFQIPFPSEKLPFEVQFQSVVETHTSTTLKIASPPAKPLDVKVYKVPPPNGVYLITSQKYIPLKKVSVQKLKAFSQKGKEWTYKFYLGFATFWPLKEKEKMTFFNTYPLPIKVFESTEIQEFSLSLSPKTKEYSPSYPSPSVEVQNPSGLSLLTFTCEPGKRYLFVPSKELVLQDPLYKKTKNRYYPPYGFSIYCGQGKGSLALQKSQEAFEKGLQEASSHWEKQLEYWKKAQELLKFLQSEHPNSPEARWIKEGRAIFGSGKTVTDLNRAVQNLELLKKKCPPEKGAERIALLLKDPFLRVSSFLTVAKKYTGSTKGKALAYLEETSILKDLELIDHPEKKASALVESADVLVRDGALEQSLFLCEKAKGYIGKIKTPYRRADLLKKMAIIYLLADDKGRVIETLGWAKKEALKRAFTFEENGQRAMILLAISGLYWDLGKEKVSLELFDKSVEVIRSFPGPFLKSLCLALCSFFSYYYSYDPRGAFVREKYKEMTQTLLQESLKETELVGIVAQKSMILIIISFVYQYTGDTLHGGKMIQESLNAALDVKIPHFRTFLYSFFALFYMAPRSFMESFEIRDQVVLDKMFLAYKKLENPQKKAADLLAQAVKSAEKIKNDTLKLHAHALVAQVSSYLGKRELSLDQVSKCMKEVSYINNEKEKGTILSQLAPTLARNGKLTDAVNMAEEIQDETLRDKTLFEIVRFSLEAGPLEGKEQEKIRKTLYYRPFKKLEKTEESDK